MCKVNPAVAYLKKQRLWAELWKAGKVKLRFFIYLFIYFILFLIFLLAQAMQFSEMSRKISTLNFSLFCSGNFLSRFVTCARVATYEILTTRWWRYNYQIKKCCRITTVGNRLLVRPRLQVHVKQKSCCPDMLLLNVYEDTCFHGLF